VIYEIEGDKSHENPGWGKKQVVKKTINFFDSECKMRMRGINEPVTLNTFHSMEFQVEVMSAAYSFCSKSVGGFTFDFHQNNILKSIKEQYAANEPLVVPAGCCAEKHQYENNNTDKYNTKIFSTQGGS
jgi:hypothetical protein